MADSDIHVCEKTHLELSLMRQHFLTRQPGAVGKASLQVFCDHWSEADANLCEMSLGWDLISISRMRHSERLW